jgi:hypothetical protein
MLRVTRSLINYYLKYRRGRNPTPALPKQGGSRDFVDEMSVPSPNLTRAGLGSAPCSGTLWVEAPPTGAGGVSGPILLNMKQ